MEEFGDLEIYELPNPKKKVVQDSAYIPKQLEYKHFLLSSESPTQLKYIMDYYYLLRDYEKALQYSSQLIKKDKKISNQLLREIWETHARILYKLKQYDKALQIIDEMEKTFGHKFSYDELKARCTLLKGDIIEAIKLYQHYISIGNSHRCYNLWNGLSIAYGKLGEKYKILQEACQARAAQLINKKNDEEKKIVKKFDTEKIMELLIDCNSKNEITFLKKYFGKDQKIDEEESQGENEYDVMNM